MARTPSTDVAEVVEPQVTRFKRVILQRPAGNKDLGQYLGFNDVSGVYPFDTPIELPADMVDFFRNQKIVQVSPDEAGNPVYSYANQFFIQDA